MASALQQRVYTALLLGLAVIGLVGWLPPVAAVPVIALVFLAGAWEWAGFAGLHSVPGRMAYVCGAGLLIAVAWRYTATEERLVGFLWLALGWWLMAALWLRLGARRGGRGAAAIAGLLVLVPAAIGLGRLILIEPQGQGLLLFLLVLVAATDVGAYFGGRRLGRHKLAPFVSPGKTWEGVAAGMLAAAGAAAVGAALLARPVLPWLVVSIAVAALSVVGDLVESMFKRQAGLKDSGRMLPGHGGVLDRIDSLTAASPAFLLALHSVAAIS